MAVHDEAGLYVRQATGLVRAAGKWSVLVYNIMFVSIGLMTLFTLSLIPAFYPGANIQLTFVLALVIVLPTSMVFAMLSVAMPRSGGDYVYVSRALGPAWGMMSNWNQTVWWILYGGVPSAFFAYYGLTPLLRSLGVLTNHAGLITWGDRLSTPTGAFLTGTALIVILVVIFATGLNFYFRIQNVLFGVAMAADRCCHALARGDVGHRVAAAERLLRRRLRVARAGEGPARSPAAVPTRKTAAATAGYCGRSRHRPGRACGSTSCLRAERSPSRRRVSSRARSRVRRHKGC